GNVVFDFVAESPGDIKVVVTGLNLARYEGAITVDPSVSAYVNYAGISTVDDDMVGGTFGNGDGVIDAGETVNLWLDMTNTGNASTTGVVTAFLTCADPLVTVVDGTSAFGVIGSGATVTATDKIQVTFDASLSDETAIEFDLAISDGGTPTWTDKFRKLVHAPDLQLTTLRIDDGPPYGNGNGSNEANEEFLLYYGLKNYGTGTAPSLTAVVTDLSGAFVIHDGTDSYPDLTPFVGGENVAGFHLEETSVATENDLEVAVTDLFGRVYRDTIELRVPDPPTDLEFDPSLGLDRMQVAWTHSTSLDVARYNVYHSLSSGGPYTLMNIDPLYHAVYLDTDLAPSTPYFYVVTSIDTSGNESAYSGEFSASTNPPQMSGFPIMMKTTTTSSPAVGDIDGDGDKEIVVGNEHVYAWHHDGIELIDGDGDAQTWGVLNTYGDAFTAAIALANLDNRAGLDIIAADLNTKGVYCMDFEGNLLPGWPKTAERNFRAAPAAGDINGDGFFEVIAVDSRGTIYVWNRDGTEYRDLGGTDGVFYRTANTSFHFETPTVCDLDGDYKDEIIVGSRADSVWAVNEDGSLVPGFPYRLGGEAAGSICAGDVDDDGYFELLVQTKGTSGKVHLVNHDGNVAAGWPRSIQMRDIFFTPSPALADFNNDGKLEAVVYWWDGVDAKIYIIDYLGTDYPGWPKWISQNYTESSIVVADVNGDNVPDILLGDESRYIYAWDINGNMMPGFPIAAQDAVRATPFVSDVDDDGDCDVVLYSWDQNIYSFDLSAAYSPDASPWPTLQANSHRNGCIGFVVPTAVTPETTDVPVTRAELGQNYPNPFNPSTQIVYYVPVNSDGRVSLVIYDVTGARVRTLENGTKMPGRHIAVWNGRNDHGNPVGSGVYFYRMTQKGFTDTKKMLLLK
ncbi:MAG: VCBS repeat-containing protein, partial [Candidatus Latescibacterota bacterium]